MALVRCDFFSEVLGLSTSMTVLLPEGAAVRPAARSGAAPGHPTLYLLHGLSDDDTVWVRRTALERYVEPLGLAVVMPQAHRSFYMDETRGVRYWTFLSEELPAVAQGFFRLSQRREDTFVAGLSMGGYGAMKWALRHPGRFAAAASLSGALDLAELQRTRAPELGDVDRRVFDGVSVAGTPDDLLALVAAADPATVPDLLVTCGDDDDLYADNLRFAARAQARGLPLTTRFGPGAHDWEYWDATIRTVLDWLPLGR